MKVPHPDSLSNLLSGTNTTNILHSLLHEKYMFEQQKVCTARGCERTEAAGGCGCFGGGGCFMGMGPSMYA